MTLLTGASRRSMCRRSMCSGCRGVLRCVFVVEMCCLSLTGTVVVQQVEAFFDVHEALGTVPGGIHLEMTGDDVTECLGGGSAVAAEDLDSRYHTHCDPRLNAAQALEMSFYIAGRLHKRTPLITWECLQVGKGAGTVHKGGLESRGAMNGDTCALILVGHRAVLVLTGVVLFLCKEVAYRGLVSTVNLGLSVYDGLSQW
jgi:hypothetical protein